MKVSGCFALSLLVNARSVAANFLAANSRSVSAASVSQLLESELPSASNDVRLRTFKLELEPMYLSLPKNEFGRLEPVTVRYALHRHFAHKYGWYVRGLTGDGDAFTANSSAEILKDRVPSHIQNLLERKVRGRGLNLDELATFAATLVDLIEMDALAGFQECFDALDLPRVGPVDERDISTAMRGYLARFIFGADQEVQDASILHAIEDEIKAMYSAWPATVMWLRDAHKTVEWMEESRRNPFKSRELSFASAASDLQEVMHRFAEVANSECPEIKDRLLGMEHEGTGRVRLVDFYTSAPLLGIKAESKAYLRNLGVLDETDAERPMLLIANFISSNTNCLVDASYYSSCCLNECERLFGKLEHAIAAPTAKPAHIVDVISHLPSDTVDAPRNLSISMVSRLSEIAQQHGGQVPLHGRLFTQWMHHAYPRECPYPQLRSGERPLSQEEFFTMHGLEDVFVTSDEMAQHTDPENIKHWETAPRISKDDLPWNHVEELVAAHKYGDSRPPSSSGHFLRILMACVAFSSMALGLTRTLTAGAFAVGKEKAITCV